MKDGRSEAEMIRAVLRRLGSFRQLSCEAEKQLAATIRSRITRASAGQELVSPGDRTDYVRIVLTGWLARYKMLEDGRRQVISLILPGDACNAFGHLIGGADHSIVTLTPAAFAEIDRGRFEELMALDPALTEAMLCDTLLQLAIAQEWIVNIGRRVALERVAHLLCEIFERLHAVDLLEGDSCPFPITQMDLADATGLSIVHLNRTLQELRGSGLIVLRERHLTIVDREALENLSLFHPDYLRVVPGKLP